MSTTTSSASASSVSIQKDFEAFSILEFLPRKSGQAKKGEAEFNPKKIVRLHDNAVFSIGDEVTNGMESEGRQCRGKITGFGFLEDKVFVSHTWSGVGWNLGSISIIREPEEPRLPSEFQIDDEVWLNLWSNSVATVIKGVHFYKGKIKYDVEVNARGGDGTTRLYNIDSNFLSRVHPDHKSN